MDAMMIRKTVLSIPTPHIYNGDDAKAYEAAENINDELSLLCKENDRFLFVAGLSVPYMEGSIKEAERAMKQLGAIGVKLPSNAYGVYLGDVPMNH